MKKMEKFEIGKKYTGVSVCDSDCVITIEVINRTEKTLKVKGNNSLTKESLRVKIDMDGNEYVNPWGVYSMAPIIRAEREAE
jgi:hypothetical protein